MATLDEIFATMPDAPAGGTHEPLVIDPNTREIEIPEIESIFGVASDGNAEKKYFQCPRYVGAGIDLAACRLRISYQNASNTEEGRDGYLVKDTTVSGEYVYFSWELSPKVCLYNGAVQFAVCAMLGDTVAWHTAIATGTVLEGMEYNGEIVQTEMQDVITQLIAMVETQSAAVEAAGAAAVAKINAAAADTAPAIVCQAEGVAIQVADASDRPLRGLRIFGRSTQDGTPTPDNPVEIVSTPAPAVKVCGKNLINTDFVQLSGQPMELPVFEGMAKLPITFSWVQDFARSTGSALFSFEIDGVTSYSAAQETAGAYQKAFTDGNALTRVSVLNWSIETGTLSNMQLEIGNNATEYQPPAFTQTIALTTSLPGVPVASGGNYADADGQQWICDEVDLGRGVYVQRIGKIESYSGEEIGGVYMSTTGALDIGTSVIYSMSTPIETPLSEAELAAFAALHSVKPTTTILNDSGAHMAVEYVADTKLYIDSKLADLAAAMNA